MTIRTKALLQAVVLCAAATAIHGLSARLALPTAMVCLALFLTLSGLYAPRLFRAWERSVGQVARALTHLLAGALLTLVYYLCVLPLSLLLRKHSNERLQRAFPSHEQSFWVARQPHRDIESYRRQY